MPDLLGRELTAQEEAVKAALEGVLRNPRNTRDSNAAIRSLLCPAPEAFCAAVLFLLGTQHDPARRQTYNALADCREFWIALMREARLSRSHLLEVCRHFMTIESMLDIRLARLTPGREETESSQLDAETVLRILDVLDKLSPGSRLILLLNHLTQHPDRRIAAKATLLIGRRIRNQDWVARHLASSDGRVRASTIEGLWGVRSPAARSSLWVSLQDKNNRVVGNALIGLHQLGEPAVNEFMKRMIEDPRPAFRWTAAWVMGKVGAEEFAPFLEQALKDKESHVQRVAERALEIILQRALDEAAAQQTEFAS